MHLVDEGQEIQKILKRCTEIEAEALVSARGDFPVYEATVCAKHYSPVRLLRFFEFCLDEGESADADLSQDLLTARSSLSMTVFLQGQLLIGLDLVGLELESGIWKCPTPSRLYKIQRRREARMEIRAAYDVNIVLSREFDGKTVVETKRIFDISGAGCSFLVSAQKKDEYSHHQKLRGSIRLRGREIPVRLEIKNIIERKVGNEATFKMGCHFESISPKDSDFIAMIVACELSYQAF